MTYMTHEDLTAAISLNVWEIVTGNGRDVDEQDWDEVMIVCNDAVNNTYFKGIDITDWQEAAVTYIKGF